MASLIYNSPRLYRIVMRLLYGRHFSTRYEVLSSLIPEGSSVVDVCCGDALLFTSYLRRKKVDYLGLDISEQMLKEGVRNGARCKVFDVWSEPIPRADYVVIQSSLCQFLPRADAIVEKLLASAECKLIVSEPVRNWSSSSNPLLKFIGQRMTRPEKGEGAYTGDRFNEESLSALFQTYPEFEAHYTVPGGREMIGVFRGRGTRVTSAVRSG